VCRSECGHEVDSFLLPQRITPRSGGRRPTTTTIDRQKYREGWLFSDKKVGAMQALRIKM